MENRKCKSYFGDYKCHVATNVKDSKGDFVYVDKCLKEAIENLNAQGLKTIASCCGHGIINPKITIEGLSDGGVFETSASGLNLACVINWVKLEEKKPDNQQKCWCADSDGNRFLCTYSKYSVFRKKRTFNNMIGKGWPVPNIVKWQPLVLPCL